MTNNANEVNRSESSFVDYAAIKTAIANGEIERVKSLLEGRKLQILEKDFLINLAKTSGHSRIVKLLKNAPSRR